MSLLTLTETAEQLGVSIRTVRRLAKAGDITPVNVAPTGTAKRAIRIERRSVEEFVARRSLRPAERTARRRNKWDEIDAFIAARQGAGL